MLTGNALFTSAQLRTGSGDQEELKKKLQVWTRPIKTTGRLKKAFCSSVLGTEGIDAYVSY